MTNFFENQTCTDVFLKKKKCSEVCPFSCLPYNDSSALSWNHQISHHFLKWEAVLWFLFLSFSREPGCSHKLLRAEHKRGKQVSSTSYGGGKKTNSHKRVNQKTEGKMETEAQTFLFKHEWREIWCVSGTRQRSHGGANTSKHFCIIEAPCCECVCTQTFKTGNESIFSSNNKH